MCSGMCCLQLDNYEEGAKCFFTFMFHNPESELVKSNVDFYRKTLKLGSDEFVWRETPILPHQDRFLAGQHCSVQVTVSCHRLCWSHAESAAGGGLNDLLCKF